MEPADICFLPIAEASQLIARKELSPVDVLNAGSTSSKCAFHENDRPSLDSLEMVLDSGIPLARRPLGLSGEQGVMIPRDNLRNLVLKDEVVDAVRERRCHIYGVSTIDEGIEILTGVPAGEHQEGAAYPDGTVHFLVEARLQDMAKKVRKFGRAPERNDKQKRDEES